MVWGDGFFSGGGVEFWECQEMQWSTFYVVAGRVGGGCVGVLSIAGKI